MDTSAVVALFVADDRFHHDAVATWDRCIVTTSARLFTTSYIVAEMYDLMRRRFGFSAIVDADRFVQQYLDIVFVGREQHDAGRELLFKRKSRDLSLVDCVSFAVARKEEADAVFAYDRHFEDEGFDLLRP